MITGLDHVQIAIPSGGEERARTFYGALLGMPEIPIPKALAGKAVLWFRSGSAELHIGVEEPFTPARKAHPALLATDLDALQATLEGAGHDCTRSDGQIPGVKRFHTQDPFGNRIECQQA